VCGGDDTDCAGCDGVIWSGKKLDKCGKCDGDDTTCVDACGKVNGDNSTCKGCDNVVLSGKNSDKCGVCGGDGSSCEIGSNCPKGYTGAGCATKIITCNSHPCLTVRLVTQAWPSTGVVVSLVSQEQIAMQT